MKAIKTIVSLLLVLAVFTLAACGAKTSPDQSTEAPASVSETDAPLPSDVTESAPDATTEIPSDVTGSVPADTTTTTAPAESTTAAAPESTTAAPESTTAAQNTDYSAYTKDQILSYLSEAINKTKGYTGNITVNHKESFTSTVTNVTPGGALVTRAVNFVKDLVLKPSEEVYSFSGGTATTSEGETTQLLLPKDAAFTLTPDGVANATIQQEGDKVHVVLTLAAEEVNSLSAVPKYNSSAIGYLNLDGRFSIIQIEELTIKYPGSVIDAYVRADGYVDSVTYTITLDASSKAKGMGITGTADFYGDQVEVWKINW